ncbi:hypothetical protein J1G18_13860 [Pseudomonas sp. MIS38]|uniref:hypothetical protein n=1 Tax=Pseudomonas sp. MIS38 TaxID=91465 RepID=UPI001CA785DA|nr:hypothetical protein [Pseudomonas sp. MIS38]MBY8958373.1 hypothetical protein [Pseudomonas sp. MIS38]
MQSADYVSGVSGWKFTKGLLEINGGPMGPVRIGDLDKEESGSPSAAEPSPKPFIIVDGVTYIRQESSNESSTEKPKLAPQWAVKFELLDGKYVAAGIGLSLSGSISKPDIVVKASSIEMLDDGMVRIKQQQS